MTLTYGSSNTTLVPAANIVLGGSGTNRTVTVTPAANQTGTATITVTVSDGVLTASDTFMVTVNPATSSNTAPTISDIPDQTIVMGGNTGAIAFTVYDAEKAAGRLKLSKSSSNTTLVPKANILLGGSGADRKVTVTPAANQSGTATITVTVSDGTLTARDTFVVTVNAANSIASSTPTLTSSDVGKPAIAGSSVYDAGTDTHKVTAAGTDIWGVSDQFRFVHQNVSGDATLIVHLTALTNTNSWAKAGLMLRTSLAADAQHVSVFATPGNGVVMQARSTPSAITWSSAGLSRSIPEWLRLDRVGNTFYAFRSGDGMNWEMVDFITVDIPASLLGGMAVTSHNSGAATTATFTGFNVD